MLLRSLCSRVSGFFLGVAIKAKIDIAKTVATTTQNISTSRLLFSNINNIQAKENKVNQLLDSPKPFIIGIDPGHGGSDPGAVGKGDLREADINLAVAKEMYAQLTFLGFEPILTRISDERVSLHDRVTLCKDCHVFVSLHCNGSVLQNAHGFEVLYPAPTNSRCQDKALANSILQGLQKAMPEHRSRG